MTARTLIAASILIVAGSAYAAEAPATVGANAAVTAAATAAATATSDTASKLNLPVMKGAAVRSRESVRAEAVEAVKNHRTTLAQQLDLAK